MKAETKKNLVELKKLSDESQLNLYRRLQLVAEVLTDDRWLSDEFDGDVAKAEIHLGSQYCPDLLLVMSMRRLMLIFNAFPQRKTWEENHYDLRAMGHLYAKSIGKDKQASKPKQWKSIAKDEMQKRKASEDQLFAVKSSLQIAGEKIAKLEMEIERLTTENAMLTGQIQQLERFVAA